MEFHEKLQELRKEKGLTQEELAASLYVSRTAISKWESGRGYPSIDSLRAIAKFFSVSLDTLLSGEELLTVAEEDGRQKRGSLRDLVFGLLDISACLLLFLPFFAEKSGEAVKALSLLLLSPSRVYLKAVYLAIVIGTSAFGVLTLSLQNLQSTFWLKFKNPMSISLNLLGAFFFILGAHPYAAVLLLFFLVIKVFLLLKKD